MGFARAPDRPPPRRLRRSRSWAGLALATPLVAAAVAIGPAGPPIDLAASDSLQIIGAAGGDRASDEGIVAAGDVNGDGRPDLLVGARLADNNGRSNSGSAYVVFGQGNTAAIDLGALATAGGYRIDGAAPGEEAGESVAAAGDVNGDGRPDAIVGARFADNNGRSNSGSAYVVFGTRERGPVDLGALGAGGFRIDGAAAADLAGASVAGVGDVNGDGLDDVAVGSPDGERAHVIFGRTSITTIDLAGLGGGGYALVGPSDDEAGQVVAGVGDVNGDGRPDVAVGDPGADVNGGASGSVFVTFGKASAAALTLEALGSAGYRIDGERGGDRLGDDGLTVGPAGDVNADGHADLAIGAEAADPGGEGNAGSAWVIFGHGSSTSVDLGALAGNGHRIDGPRAGAELGEAVAGLGDINGDGIPDLALGADGSDNNGRLDSGSVWVVLGTRTPAPLRLASPGGRAFRIDGPAGGDSLGDAVAGVADVDGDGRPEILAGSELADPAARSDAGRGWAISSGRALATAATGLVAAIDSTAAIVAGTVDPSGLATSHAVEFGPTPGYGRVTAATAAGSGGGPVAAGATLTGLAPSTTYHYRQTVTTAAGHSSYGADRTFTTAPDTAAPAPPAVAGGALGWQVRAALEFTASGATDVGGSGLAGYEVRSSRDAGRSWSAPTAGAALGISAEGETLVQFRARDGAGNSSAWVPAHLDGPAAAGTARLDRTPPGAVARLTGTTPARARPLLSWAAAADAGGAGTSGYRILRDGVTIGTATATEFVDPAPPASGTLSYRVVAVDAAGNEGPPGPAHRVKRTTAASRPEAPGARPLAIAVVPKRLPIVAGRVTIGIRCAVTRGACRGGLAIQGPIVRAGTRAAPVVIARAGRRLRLGRRSFRVPAGRTRNVAVAITPSGLRAVARSGALAARVVVVARRAKGRRPQVRRIATVLVLGPGRPSR